MVERVPTEIAGKDQTENALSRPIPLVHHARTSAGGSRSAGQDFRTPASASAISIVALGWHGKPGDGAENRDRGNVPFGQVFRRGLVRQGQRLDRGGELVHQNTADPAIRRPAATLRAASIASSMPGRRTTHPVVLAAPDNILNTDLECGGKADQIEGACQFDLVAQMSRRANQDRSPCRRFRVTMAGS